MTRYELPPGMTAYADRRNLRAATREVYAYVVTRLKQENPTDPIQWLIDLLRDAPLGTVLPYRAAVKLYIQHDLGLSKAEAVELVAQLPETRGKFARRQREALNRDQLLRFVQLVRGWQPSSTRTILLLLPLTGLRITEACSLRVEAITPTGLQVEGKRGKTRRLPITPAVRALFDEWLVVRGENASSWLFPGRNGEPIDPTTVRKAIRKRGLKTEFGKHFSPHVLRHSWATSALRRKVDLVRIQELLGHEDVSTTAKYLHLDPESRQEAMETIEREILGNTE